MISKIAGSIFNKDTKTKATWIKLAAALVLSNIFFFLLFSKSETAPVANPIEVGWVEIHTKAELLTPFHSGKKVLLLHRGARLQVEAVLKTSPTELEGHYTILVHESKVDTILKHNHWEIVPFLKTITFAPVTRGVEHEIRY